jgi:hypothetical protein
MRAGDSLSAGLVWIGVRTAMSARTYFAINLVLVAIWAALSLLLGRMYAQRSAAMRGGTDVA